MSWFKVDDGFSTSPKVLSIPRAHRLAAVGLWTIAGTWCAKHLTDGAVPAFMLEEWAADVSLGTALVDAGLWTQTEGGYAFHDWKQYQPARVDVQAYRDKERRRKEEWRAKKAEKSGQSPAIVPTGQTEGQDDVSQRPSALPDPTRPDPTRPVKRDSTATRGARIPKDFAVDDLLRQYARSKAPAVDVDRETEKFINYWTAVSGAKGVKKDWVATWRNWMLQAQGYAERDGWKPPAAGETRADAAAEDAARDAWLAARGITFEEYQQHWDEPGWLDDVERRFNETGGRGA